MVTVLSTTLSVSCGLRIGLEGPFVHIGACVGILTLYWLPWSAKWRNDKEKRIMVATGAGVGIAVTFGAPVGGVIFAYEITRNTAFWTSGTFFRCLTASTVGVYFYTLLWQIRLGDIQHVITTGILPLSLIDTVPTFHMGDIFVWILIGIGCAIMGSVFNGVSNFCNSL